MEGRAEREPTEASAGAPHPRHTSSESVALPPPPLHPALTLQLLASCVGARVSPACGAGYHLGRCVAAAASFPTPPPLRLRRSRVRVCACQLFSTLAVFELLPHSHFCSLNSLLPRLAFYRVGPTLPRCGTHYTSNSRVDDTGSFVTTRKKKATGIGVTPSTALHEQQQQQQHTAHIHTSAPRSRTAYLVIRLEDPTEVKGVRAAACRQPLPAITDGGRGVVV